VSPIDTSPRVLRSSFHHTVCLFLKVVYVSSYFLFVICNNIFGVLSLLVLSWVFSSRHSTTGDGNPKDPKTGPIAEIGKKEEVAF